MNWEWDIARFLIALLAGATLSFAGSLIQMTTRNELATPSTLGMDGLAVLMVMAAYLLEGLGISAGGLSETALLIGIAIGLLGYSWLQLSGASRLVDFKLALLFGLSLNLFVGALFAVMQFLAMAFNREFPEQLWFGRVQILSTHSWLIAGPIWLLLLHFLFSYRRAWKILLLGESWCLGLHVPVAQIYRRSVLIAFLLTLWSITQFGVFSFLGLLFPLILRQLPRYRAQPWREMTEGAVACGLLFALIDHACFNVTFHGSEIPVGLPSSLFGAAALVTMLWRRMGKLAG